MPTSVSTFLCESIIEDTGITKVEALRLSRKLALQAAFYENREQKLEAEMLYELSILIAERSSEDDDLHIATCSHHLADLYVARSVYALAAPLYARSISIWESAFGAGHKVVGLALHSYAEVLMRLGRHTEADEVVLRSRNILGDLSGVTAAQMADGMQLNTF